MVRLEESHYIESTDEIRFVDGKDYMYAVSTAIEQARVSIWILDWWLSPELYLRRMYINIHVLLC